MQDIHKILQLGYNQVVPKPGRVLLSLPFFDQDPFSRAVILMIEHDENSSFGLILNKPLRKRVGEVLVNECPSSAELFLGGPVDTSRLFCIFRGDYPVGNSLKISENLSIVGDFDDLFRLMQKRQLPETDVRFFLGYSGWSAGQLSRELQEDTWVVSHLVADEIFDTPAEMLWKRGLERLGGDYSQWAMLPSKPEYN